MNNLYKCDQVLNDLMDYFTTKAVIKAINGQKTTISIKKNLSSRKRVL